MKIEIVSGDDWQGIYLDGKLACEDHSIDIGTLLRVLKLKYTSYQVDQDWVAERGDLPETFKEIPKKVLSK